MVFCRILSIQTYGFKEEKTPNHCSIIQSCTCFGDVDLGIDLASRESNSCLKWSVLEYHLAYGYELIENKLK